MTTPHQWPHSTEVQAWGDPCGVLPDRNARACGAGRNLEPGPSPPRTPVGPRQAASTSGPGVLTQDAGAHAICTRPGSHCEALGVRGWGGKPLAGPHPPPSWDPGQVVSGPATPLPAPGGCPLRGERIGSRSSPAFQTGTRRPGPRGTCSKRPCSLLRPVRARPGWELGLRGPQPSSLDPCQLSAHTCPGARLRGSQGGPSRPPHSPEALGGLPTAAAHPPNARRPRLRTSVRQVPG